MEVLFFMPFLYLFREELQKYSLFIGFIQLELSFGSHEAAEAIFRRALEITDPLKVYNGTTKLYEQNNMIEVSCTTLSAKASGLQEYLAIKIFARLRNW